MTLESLAKRVLFEDNHLLIINKLPSEIVQGDKTGDQPLVELCKVYIKKKYNKPGEVFLGVVHRIDRPVSGAVIFARTSKALTRMNELLRNRDFTKTYWAVVDKKPSQKEATIEHFLLRNPKQNKSYPVSSDREGAKLAQLSYRYLYSSDRYHLLEVDLHTGRHHQIRAQLAAIGSPIKGDLKYGFDRPNKGGSIHLHARKIVFIHPVQKCEISIEAPPPNDPLWNFYTTKFSKK